MKEKQIHRIWLEELWKESSLISRCGASIRIISPGIPNADAGPDFFNAMVRIGGITWAGNVEIHRRSSDWYRHGHHLDDAYNNVILHLVLEDDARIMNHRGRMIPTLLLPPTGSGGAPEAGGDLIMDPISCLPESSGLGSPIWKKWLAILYRERMAEKRQRLMLMYRNHRQNWEDILYLSLGCGFGLPINVLPFSMTLSRIPLELMLSLRDDLSSLEALLFGQAGLLPEQDCGPYGAELTRRFQKISKDLGTTPLKTHLWKFLRLRPASFPTLRLSQFAMLVHRRFPMLDTLLDLDSPGEVEPLLRVGSTAYWNTHYRFDKSSAFMEKNLGKQAMESIVVNTIAPFLLSIGEQTENHRARALGEALMEESRAESNRITRLWRSGDIRAVNAMESQALIRLYKEYCKQKRCYDCLIGKLIYLKD